MKCYIFHSTIMLLALLILISSSGCEKTNPAVSPEDIGAVEYELGVTEDSGFAADFVTQARPALAEKPSMLALAPMPPGFCGYPKVKLDVLFIPQVPPGEWSNTKNCGQASTLNVVGYLRRQCMPSSNITDENNWLAKTYNDTSYKSPNGWYTDTAKFVNLAKNYWAYRNSAAGNGTLDTVYAELKANRPVVVAVRLNMDSNPSTLGHFMVLTGMDNSTVWVNDVGKSQGKDKTFPLSQFQQSWATQRNAYVSIK